MLIRCIGVISWNPDPTRLDAMQTEQKGCPSWKKVCRLWEEAADDYILISEHGEQRHSWSG